MSKMLEHDHEPEPGLPQPLPDGERLLWQGGSDFRSLLLHSFHLRLMLAYFAAVLIVHFSFGIQTESAVAALKSTAGFALLALVAIGLVVAYARALARATLFTVTSERVIVRTGIALPVTINLPYGKIDAADLRQHKDGSGDLVLRVTRDSRVSWLLLWPMVKPWRLFRTRPVLRGIANGQALADVLGDALRASLASAPGERPEAVPSAGPTEPKRFRPYPTIPLAAGVSLVCFALVGAGWSALYGKADQAASTETLIEQVELYFEDQADGAVLVREARGGTLIDRIEPGSNGFIRATLRTLVRAREALGVGDEEPFAVARTESGRILLIDRESDREIDLRAFGTTNTAAFSRYLDGTRLPDSAGLMPSKDAAKPETQLALKQQEATP